MKAIFLAVLGFWIQGWAVEALANTWFVDQIGESGVVTIQEAVDLAASGDTIRVGPGFYEDFHQVPAPLENENVVVHVTQEELTLIGAGPHETTIGQRIDWAGWQGPLRGILAGSVCFDNQRLNIRDLGFEGVYSGVLFGEGGVFTANNCRFQRNHTGIAAYSFSFQDADSALVQNCVFEPWDDMLSTQHIWTNGWNYLSVKDSFLQMQEIGITSQIRFEGKSLLVENCEMVDGRAGIVLACEDATTRNVYFNSQEFYGVVTMGGVMTIQNCQVDDTRSALYENDYEGRVRWAVSGLTVSNVSESTLKYISLGDGYIRNSILARGEELVVKYDLFSKGNKRPDFPTFDMTDNWWGTTNADSIKAWIYDGVDDVDTGVLIDFEPFKTEPLVGVEETSLSGFKDLFR